MHSWGTFLLHTAASKVGKAGTHKRKSLLSVTVLMCAPGNAGGRVCGCFAKRKRMCRQAVLCCDSLRTGNSRAQVKQHSSSSRKAAKLVKQTTCGFSHANWRWKWYGHQRQRVGHQTRVWTVQNNDKKHATIIWLIKRAQQQVLPTACAWLRSVLLVGEPLH